MVRTVRLLLIDKDPRALETLSEALERGGHETAVVPDDGRALERLEAERFDLVVVDVEMGQRGADELIREIRRRCPRAPVIATTGQASMEGAVRALRGGVADYLAKPFDPADVMLAVERALEPGRAGEGESVRGGTDAPSGDEAGSGEGNGEYAGDSEGSGARVRSAGAVGPYEFEELVGRNPRMQRVYSLIQTVAPAGSTVLVTGESGTGKERVAAAIHRRSGRSNGPFVRVNCSAFAEGVLESELFGHEQGAFTGAHRARAGVFRRADGGSLFLDEVADLPHATQVKLLRVIQEREVQPVGGDRAVPVDVRMIAATNRDLAEEVRKGTFREDLYFRLNVIPIHIPSLRERPDDIPHLVDHFLAKFADSTGKPVRGFTDRALSSLERYGWPGNVRELENAVERAVVLATEEIIDVHDLPPEVRGVGSTLEGAFQINTVKLAEVEEIVIRRVLTKNAWNIKRSAEMLGITRATLYSKIRKLGLTEARPTQ
jgi:DNA-binding NtrC family response regulator